MKKQAIPPGGSAPPPARIGDGGADVKDKKTARLSISGKPEEIPGRKAKGLRRLRRGRVGDAMSA